MNSRPGHSLSCGPHDARLAMLGLLAVFVPSGMAAAADGSTLAATHAYGWWSVAPPVVAIVAAAVSRRVLPALLLGVFTGALILADFRPLLAIGTTLETHLWGALVDEDHLRVFAFTSLMGAMAGLLNRSGGMHGLVDRILPWAGTRRGAQMTTWGLGLVVFFDDFANTVLLGNTVRPMTDRLRISRAKLAYLVDSTAAPVAGLAIVSTWVATEVSYIEQGLEEVGIAGQGFAIFMATIPYRFYVLWSLAFVAMVAWLGRDFGPMLAAERTAADGKSLGLRDPAGALRGVLEPAAYAPRRMMNAVVPIVTVLVAVLAMFYYTGTQSLAEDPEAAVTVQSILGGCDPYSSLLYGALAGVLVATGMVRAQGILDGEQIREALAAGARTMLPGLGVLWLAWSLSAVTQHDYLDTGEFLGALVARVVTPGLLPTLVFVLSAAISFATGTSWGTMAIVVPLSIRVAANFIAAGGTAITADDPLLVATVGSVLAGAIFGDHCSPISDTTVLSSQASGCNHLEHVATQLPYAAVVGIASILFGTLPVGYGVPVWPLSIVGLGALALWLRVVGRKVE